MFVVVGGPINNQNPFDRFVCLFVCLSVCSFVCLFVCLFVCVCVRVGRLKSPDGVYRGYPLASLKTASRHRRAKARKLRLCLPWFVSCLLVCSFVRSLVRSFVRLFISLCVWYI